VSFLSTAVQSVLEQGQFCTVATSTEAGPHCTPLVFAYSGGRLWLTTSRRSAKTRAWRSDPAAAGLVRHGDLAVTFTGTVKLYDALDRGTWGDAVAGATSIARATAAFSRKNARFFAGYAFDAKQVPFAWTPPGRVFVGIDLERTALVDDEGVQEGKGRWGGEVSSHGAFRRSTTADDPLAVLPREVRQPLGREGEGALTLVGNRGPVVVPARWRVDEHALYTALPEETLALAAPGPDVPAALTVDHVSAWRARDMVGAMIQGTASIYVLSGLGGGSKTARSLAREIHPEAGALVRLGPSRLVWWRGWSSGSAVVG
jgi:pyridoxamine 5'-phosphate oxidase-like protein